MLGVVLECVWQMEEQAVGIHTQVFGDARGGLEGCIFLVAGGREGLGQFAVTGKPFRLEGELDGGQAGGSLAGLRGKCLHIEGHLVRCL